jgi:hypothetical protein|eukprot:31098-Pelagococcus_subviridis.AAC.9
MGEKCYCRTRRSDLPLPMRCVDFQNAIERRREHTARAVSMGDIRSFFGGGGGAPKKPSADAAAAAKPSSPPAAKKSAPAKPSDDATPMDLTGDDDVVDLTATATKTSTTPKASPAPAKRKLPEVRRVAVRGPAAPRRPPAIDDVAPRARYVFKI